MQVNGLTPVEVFEGKLRAIVARIAPHVTPGFAASADLYRDLGVKSVSALDLLLSIEEEFAISIDDEAFGEARSVDKLIRLVGRMRDGTTAA
jgi:hypothetical protein